jgi:hypothetical protein
LRLALIFTDFKLSSFATWSCFSLRLIASFEVLHFDFNLTASFFWGSLFCRLFFFFRLRVVFGCSRFLLSDVRDLAKMLFAAAIEEPSEDCRDHWLSDGADERCD